MSSAIVYENSVKFKMAISQRSHIFKIGENGVKNQSLLFHLSHHLYLYVLPELSIASDLWLVSGSSIWNSVNFKMAAISQRSQTFEIGENSVKNESLHFHLSHHLYLYVLPELSIASEFAACLGL